jgi:16S rRNA (cytidine1402-2'-O)-methyltransferase
MNEESSGFREPGSHDPGGLPLVPPDPEVGKGFRNSVELPSLTLIATPIGNLGDLTLRAVDVLRRCDALIAEDTRRAAQLMNHLGIRKPLVSFHEHNEERRLPELMNRFRTGEKLALVTDAGTPSVSDPGFRLVRACIASRIGYTVLPGPSAVITALVGSGLPPVPFSFGGFLPSSGSGRRSELKKAAALGYTSIYFESPHRLVDCLEDLVAIAPLSQVCVARELTKIHEEYRRGNPVELAAHYAANPPRGEITLVIDPDPSREPVGRKKKVYSENTPIPRNLA